MLEILGVEDAALTLDRRSYDQRVVPGQVMPLRYLKGLAIKSLGRLNRQKRAKHSGQILLGFRDGHGLGEAPQSNIKELLEHLIADDSLACGYCPENQLSGYPSLRRSAPVERVDKEVGVEEESTVHSFRHE